MIIINGETFYEKPGSCGTCPFLFFSRSTSGNLGCPSDMGHCRLFNEYHHTWAYIPRRCSKLFRNAFANYPDGSNLVLVKKD